jgi:DNA-binding response OmpR family regulator
MEFSLLVALASDPTRVFTKRELLRDIWGFREPARTCTLDSHACRLRRKLAAHGAHAVTNLWGVGYRLGGWDIASGGIALVAGSRRLTLGLVPWSGASAPG